MIPPSLPNKPFFWVREVPQYFPYGISLTTVYRWIEAGELMTVGPKFKQRIPRASLLKKLSQF